MRAIILRLTYKPLYLLMLVFFHSPSYCTTYNPSPSPTRPNNTEKATKPDNNNWTAYGQIQSNNPDITTQYKRGNDINQARITILNHPISNNAVLPYSKSIPDASSSDSITMTTTPGEYEPASFVIQSGKQQLNQVVITISNLVNESDDNNYIESESIDTRLVKAWFQSSDVMRRSNRKKPKRLVPELLLHDNELVKVDYKNQLNLVRTKPSLTDAPRLKPFSIQPHFNQQLWLTLNTPETTKPGNYRGEIVITAHYNDASQFRKTLAIRCKVLPFQLEKTDLFMGQYYLARLAKGTKTYYSARGKNLRQMEAELRDMKEHGVNLITLDHGYVKNTNSAIDFLPLVPHLELIKKAQLLENPLIYIDWSVGEHDDVQQYKRKLESLRFVLKKNGVNDFWVYNRDEKKLSILKKSLHTFAAAHNVGAKNIVAITRADIAITLKDHLDIAVVQHRTKQKTIDEINKTGAKTLAYGLPHAGEEKPAATRYTYGLGLVEKGFSGTISYAYQAGECWDDWMHWEKSHYRPNVMAYPTTNQPIPTLQWEAWREGVDDLRYLATFAKLSGKSNRQALNDAYRHNASSPETIRQYFIEKILSLSVQ